MEFENTDLTILPVKTDKSGVKLKRAIHPNLPDLERCVIDLRYDI